MTRRTLLALNPGHPGQIEALESDFRIIRLWNERDPETAIQENADRIEAITTYLSPVKRALIDALPNLKIIACGAVGTDHMDLPLARERGIAVTHTPDVLTEDVADLGLALLLTVSRRIVEGDAFVRAGLWKGKAFPLATSLTGKTLGIVGLGRIGKAIAKRAEAFGLTILYTGRGQKPDSPYTFVPSLKALAEQSDYLLLICQGGPETEGIVDLDILQALGPKGYLINVARGSVVKEQDLLVALRNKDIAGAALDVYEREPDVPEAFFTMDNVVLTPHIGSATHEVRTAMGRLVVDNLKAFFEGRTPPTLVQ